MANTIHVAASGNDTTGDGSVGTPYKTFSKAMSVAGVGDTVTNDNLGDTFREQITVSQNGMTITGGPVINGAGVITGWAGP